MTFRFRMRRDDARDFGLAAMGDRSGSRVSVDRANLIISAPRGSGGAMAHLGQVVPRMLALRPGWNIRLVASPEVLKSAFGSRRESWMHPLADSGYATRLRWEFRELPVLLAREPRAIVYAPFGPPLNVSLGPRTVCMARNIIPLLDPADWEITEEDRGRALLLRVAFVLSARSARRMICVSTYARERLAMLSGKRMSHFPVVPHGAETGDAARRCTNPEAERLRGTRFLLHVGQPVPYRRTHEVIEAYARLVERNPDVPTLVLVGESRGTDKPYGDSCVALAAPLVARKKIVILPQVTRADSMTMMMWAEATVYPSVHEDCPNIILEALAAGQVIVCGDIPATRDLCADAAIYVRDPRGGSLADAIEGVLADPERMAALRREARARAALFTWDATASRTVAVLEEELARLRGLDPVSRA